MRRNGAMTAGVAAAVLSFGLPALAGEPPAAPEASGAPNGLIVRDVHEAAALGDEEAQQMLEAGNTAKGASCSWWEPCGVVHNRTRFPLYLSRDSASHTACNARGPYNWLPSGSNSDTRFRWEDTDCFSGGNNRVYYAGRWHEPWSWVRIWSHVWVY